MLNVFHSMWKAVLNIEPNLLIYRLAPIVKQNFSTNFQSLETKLTDAPEPGVGVNEGHRNK